MMVMEEKVMVVIITMEVVTEVDLVDSGGQLAIIILEKGSLETKEGM